MDEISPLQYVQITGARYQDIAELTGCSYDAVKSWFLRPGNKKHRNPAKPVLRLLAADLELRKLRARQW